MTPSSNALRHGFALIAVLLVIGASTLAVTIFLRWSSAEIAVASASAQRSRSRLLVDSGIAIVLSELDDQRDVILEGRRPELDRTYVVHEGPVTSSIIRLLSVGSERERLAPVGGLLDLNRATSLQLQATGALTQIQSDRIIATRASMPGGRYRTLEDHEGVRAIGGDKARRPFRGQKFEGALQPQNQLMPVVDVEITPRKRLAP